MPFAAGPGDDTISVQTLDSGSAAVESDPSFVVAAAPFQPGDSSEISPAGSSVSGMLATFFDPDPTTSEDNFSAQIEWATASRPMVLISCRARSSATTASRSAFLCHAGRVQHPDRHH